MKPLRLFFVAALMALVCVSNLFADLSADIQKALNDKLLSRAAVGICLARLDGGKVQILYNNNAEQPLIPASNMKVITTSAAFQILGPDFSFHTTLLYSDGDLFLMGDGDPSLGDAEMLKEVGWGTDTVFMGWAEQLKKLNITKVKDVVVDDSVFDEEFSHPRWEKHLAHRYGAPVGGLNLNANCVDFYIRAAGGNLVNFRMDPLDRFLNVQNTCKAGGKNAVSLVLQGQSSTVELKGFYNSKSEGSVSLPMRDPPMFAGQAFADALLRSGIQMDGAIRRDRDAQRRWKASVGTWKAVGIFETKLERVIARANKDSMNLYAEALCKRIGAKVSNQPGSWAAGTAAVGNFLSQLGVPSKQFNLDDGSGLSRENRISALTMVSVLGHNHLSSHFDDYLKTMAIGGVDGTIENRFEEPDIKGRVHAKTGFVEGVRTLSGYLQGRDGKWYAFSILMNGLPPGTRSGVNAIHEKIVRALDKVATPG